MKNIVAALLLGTALPGLALAQGAGQQAPSGPMMTEAHARAAMVGLDCSTVGPLGVAQDGSYHTQCTKSGRVINVMMDRTGKVSEATGVSHVTEGQARYALGAFGCNNVSALGSGPNGSWVGQCTKGGATTNVMVDNKGVASAVTGGAGAMGITEGQARYVLGDFGCNNVTSLAMGSDGSWYGQCQKSGRTQNVMVDRSGKPAAN